MKQTIPSEREPRVGGGEAGNNNSRPRRQGKKIDPTRQTEERGL